LTRLGRLHSYPTRRPSDLLIGPDTINTMPQKTMDAYRAHGRLRDSLTEEIGGAAEILAALEQAGISLDEVTAALVVEGVRLFSADRKSTRLNSSHQIASYA